MKKDFGAKTWVYPMPVLIIGSYDADGKPDAMSAKVGDAFKVGLAMK